MTDTTISDAVVFPQDDGTGVSSGNESYTSAASFALLSMYAGDGSYVGGDTAGSPTLQFANVDTTNEEVDVTAGYAYIMEAGNTVQSGAQTTYDTTLPDSVPYVVVLPTDVSNLGLGTDTSNDLWLAVDPTANDSVYIRHGSGLSAPSDPSVKLGTVDTSDGSTTRANDLSDLSVKSLAASTNIDLTSGDVTALDGEGYFGADADTYISNRNNLGAVTDRQVQTTVFDDWGFFDGLRGDTDSNDNLVDPSTNALINVIRGKVLTGSSSVVIPARIKLQTGETSGAVSGGSTSGQVTVALLDSGGTEQTVLTLLGDDQSVQIPSGDVESGDANGALELDERASVADTGKVALSRDAAVHGYAMIQDVTNDTACLVYLGGAANTVEIIHDSGGSNNYTTTDGNDGTTNIYWDSTNSRYELNNETGAQATYAVEIMKA